MTSDPGIEPGPHWWKASASPLRQNCSHHCANTAPTRCEQKQQTQVEYRNSSFQLLLGNNGVPLRLGCAKPTLNSKFLNNLSLIAIVSVHGGWSGWSLWRPCSVTCGSGVEIRLRNCTNPAPQHGGEGCKGSAVRSNVCKKDHCPGNVPNCC